MNPLVSIGSGCLICLIPLALYFLFLSFLNQRRHPTMLSGTWDFTCVLLGLSGFVLLGGPILLSILDTEWRTHWFGGDFKRIRGGWDANRAVWAAIVAGYWLLLMAGIIVVLRLRRNVTVIYNLDSSAIEETLNHSVESLGLAWQRVLGGFVIGEPGDVSPQKTIGERKKPAENAGKSAFLRIDTFRTLRHATLRWSDCNDSLRKEIELELEKRFLAGESPENPIASWFMTAAVALFFVVLLWMGFILYQMFANPRGL